MIKSIIDIEVISMMDNGMSLLDISKKTGLLYTNLQKYRRKMLEPYENGLQSFKSFTKCPQLCGGNISKISDTDTVECMTCDYSFHIDTTY